MTTPRSAGYDAGRFADMFAAMCDYPAGEPHACHTLIAAHDAARMIRELRTEGTTLTVTASPREVLQALDLARFAFQTSPVKDEVRQTLDALIRAAMAARDSHEALEGGADIG
jgi:hypothetical protein